ncbi:Tyrosine recombinase XerD [Eubacteriaceae bacterium CHKCI005]|nr:Tyrosine recombinase XerD [Eubacteriaceae bacterium CHKCI005]
MGNDKLQTDSILQFNTHLKQQEKSPATIEKYLRDVRKFFSFLKGRTIDKMLAIEYKESLRQEYAIVSANSMIASLNSFFRFLGLSECCIRQFKVQRQTYCSKEKELTKEEYVRLVKAAHAKGSERLSLLIETICGTGIRVSELQYITAEAVKCGESTVNCKGKTRTVFIPVRLQKKLHRYAVKQKITEGALFITRTGNPLNRCNIWKEMKSLCELAGVASSKVFPHNLRHLFARVFYGIERDIVKLADILGHSSINTTRIYIVTTGEEHRRKIDAMHLIL